MSTDPCPMTHNAMRCQRDELCAEIERLREILMIDGEQHAAHVRELEARHEIRHKHYCAEIERLRALPRLRKIMEREAKIAEAIAFLDRLAADRRGAWTADDCRAMAKRLRGET